MATSVSAPTVAAAATPPDSNPETAAFRQLMAQGKFFLPVCGTCAKAHWYPRAFCPFCFSDDISATENPGEGTVYSYSVMNVNPPVVIAYVEINDGPTMLTNLVDIAPGQLAIGMKVKPAWRSKDGGPPLLVFTAG